MSGTTQNRAASSSDSTPQVVKYTGDAGVREISAADWKTAGVEGQAKVVWNAENDYTLPASDFSAAALEVLKRDPHIKQP